MNKQTKYLKLIEKRKKCDLCKEDLANGAKLDLCKEDLANGAKLDLKNRGDTDALGQWSEVLGDLDADILVVGQDWGTEQYYINFRENCEGPIEKDNKTNQNLNKLLKKIDRSIEIIQSQQNGTNHKVFMTNMILCYKKSVKMNAPIKTKYYNNCRENYFDELFRIIKPRCVIALGNKVFGAMVKSGYVQSSGLKTNPKGYNAIIDAGLSGGYQYVTGSHSAMLYPVAHPGQMGINNRHRVKGNSVEKDWERISMSL